MRYLITTKDHHAPFLTSIFDVENHLNTDVEMVVYDLVAGKFTTNGNVWKDIEIDHL